MVVKNKEFTSTANPQAETFVEDLVNKSISKITSVSSPLAVYLQGSFGRGEGTVLFNDEGEPQLWRDLDLIVVYPFKESSDTLIRAQEELNQSKGVNPGRTPVESSYVSIAQLPRPVALRWRDLKMYELATNSLHLYGKDIRPKMAVQDGKIPLESGERFLLQKCMGLCKAYPHIESDSLVSNYEVSKTYLEISSALALKLGKPSADFKERVEILRESKNQAVQSILPRIEQWGQYKVQGQLNKLEEVPSRDSWEQAVDDLLQALAVLHDYPGNQLPEDRQAWIEAYYTDLSRRFLSNTFSSAIAPDWPPDVVTGTAGFLGSLAYRTYGTLVIANDRKKLLSCPLSAVYVSSIAGLLELHSQVAEGIFMEQIQEFMRLAGEEVQSTDPDIWISNLENAYQRAAKPLYGMG